MITRMVNKTVETLVYVSSDGTEWENRHACEAHERKIRLETALAEVEKFELNWLSGKSPRCSEKYPVKDSTFRWFKVENREQLEALREAFGLITFDRVFTPNVYCIETDNYNNDSYSYKLTEILADTKAFLAEMITNGLCEKDCLGGI